MKPWNEQPRNVQELAKSLYHANASIMGRRVYDVIPGFWGIGHEAMDEWGEIAADVLACALDDQAHVLKGVDVDVDVPIPDGGQTRLDWATRLARVGGAAEGVDVPIPDGEQTRELQTLPTTSPRILAAAKELCRYVKQTTTAWANMDSGAQANMMAHASNILDAADGAPPAVSVIESLYIAFAGEHAKIRGNACTLQAVIRQLRDSGFTPNDANIYSFSVQNGRVCCTCVSADMYSRTLRQWKDV